MTKTTLVLHMLDANNDALQKSVAYANPAATNRDLATFSQGLVGLTSNTYIDTERIDRISLNEAIDGDDDDDDDGE